MTTNDFALDLARCVTPPGHLWVGSGRTTVQPAERTVAGVGAFYSPPVAAHGVRLSVAWTVDGQLVIDDGNTGKGDVGMLFQGGTWYPDRLVRQGTWHWLQHDGLRSLAVQSTMVPLADGAGYLVQLMLTNRGPSPLQITTHARLEPGKVELRPLSQWVFGLPRLGDLVWEATPGVFQMHGGQVQLRVISDATPQILAPGQVAEHWISVTAGERVAPEISQPSQAALVTARAWQDRITRFTRRLPQVNSDVPGLADYYRRSVASGLVCIWESPQFVTNPFLTTSGLDGGAINTYLWDLGGYVPQAASLLLGHDLLPIARALAHVKLDAHFAIAPDGTPSGTPYSYSAFSFLSLVWSLACLVEPDEALYLEALRLFEESEGQFPHRGELLDYGTQRNMLEMRGTGWEHVVASPNAERAWCLERLAELGLHFGRTDAGQAVDLRSRAARIRQAIRDDLWDADRGWFKALFPGDHVEYAYSIQAFDALRAGACDPVMSQALLKHLTEGGFLGEYGVSSLSRTDSVHYEFNDPDWSGAGAYSGDGPALAATLYEAGQPELGFDVLRRHFWMGKHLPYFPQEHRCDTPSTVGHKRANVIAGLGGAEALIFGLTGIRAGLDGTVTAKPPVPPGRVTFKGLRIRGHEFDFDLAPTEVSIRVDGIEVYRGAPGQAVTLVSRRPA